jgi:biopolymer transport protein ExbD
MASRFHKSRVRRAEREPITSHGNLNLVPLVDILTSIVFFSLLTYTGAAFAALTSFDLALPPVVVSDPSQIKTPIDNVNLLLAVKIMPGKLRVEHSGEGGYVKEINGLDAAALDSLPATLAEIHQQDTNSSDVLVVPDDAVSYDDVIHVLERAKAARFTGISLGSRARATTATSAGEVQ